MSSCLTLSRPVLLTGHQGLALSLPPYHDTSQVPPVLALCVLQVLLLAVPLRPDLGHHERAPGCTLRHLPFFFHPLSAQKSRVRMKTESNMAVHAYHPGIWEADCRGRSKALWASFRLCSLFPSDPPCSLSLLSHLGDRSLCPEPAKTERRKLYPQGSDVGDGTCESTVHSGLEWCGCGVCVFVPN